MIWRLSALCAKARSAMPPLCTRCYSFRRARLGAGCSKNAFRQAPPSHWLAKECALFMDCFQPETPVLLDLRELVEQQRVGLPIAVRESLAKATLALDHVKKGRRGRALILPA
jgi:hypothetical protein